MDGQVDGYTYRWRDGYMDMCLDRQMGACLYGWVNVWMDGRMDECMDVWLEEWDGTNKASRVT